MKEYCIQNSKLRVSVSTYGAELMSVQTGGTEFLWQGDPAYWGRRALVMFPIVGSWPNDTYYVDGKEYKMPVNGFAKLSEFNVIEQQDDRILLELCSNDATRSSYPYDFRFTVEYTLNNNRLNVKFNIENKSNCKMPFAVGGHPGFMWPVLPNETATDYSLRFEQEEDINAITANGKTIPFLKESDSSQVKHSMFADGALYLTDLRSRWVELSGPSNSVRIYRDEFPYLILWSQTDEQASYLCIEPALSIGAKETSLNDRKEIIILNQDEQYTCQYSIENR